MFFCFSVFSAFRLPSETGRGSARSQSPPFFVFVFFFVFFVMFFVVSISSQSHPHRALLTEPSSHDPPPQLQLGLTLELKLDLELEFDLELELPLEFDVELDLELELALECWWRWGLGIGCRGVKLRSKLKTLRKVSVKETL